MLFYGIFVSFLVVVDLLDCIIYRIKLVDIYKLYPLAELN